MNLRESEPYRAKLNRRRGTVLKTLEYLRKEQQTVVENRIWIDPAAFEDRRALLDDMADWYVAEGVDIDKALLRIRDGVYGICLKCNEPIAAHRLDTAPEVPICAECQAH